MGTKIFPSLLDAYRDQGSHGLLERLSSILGWSLLARLGATLPMRLTVLVPLIGTLLMFNETVSRLLRLAPEFVNDLGLPQPENFSTSSLYFTYFGLCALGIGSAIFTLRCPTDIQTYPTMTSAIAAAPTKETPVLAKKRFFELIELYTRNTLDPDPDDEPVRDTTIHMTRSVAEEVSTLIAEMAKKTDAFGNVPSEDLDADLMEQFYYFGAYPTLNIDAVIGVLARRTRLEESLWIQFEEIAIEFSRDVTVVRYGALNVTRFFSRLATTLFFLVGISLLLIPTIKTFALLSWNLAFR